MPKKTEIKVIPKVEKELVESLKEVKESFEKVNQLWDSDINLESLKKAIDSNIIYPKFKPYKNTVYLVYIFEQPKLIMSEKGNFHIIGITKDNMKFTINMNNSFKFQLKVLLERNQIDVQTLIKNSIPLRISKDDLGYWSIQLLQNIKNTGVNIIKIKNFFLFLKKLFHKEIEIELNEITFKF